MTIAVMRAFGARVAESGDRSWRVEPGGYEAADPYVIEPDASAASYFLAAAAITGGRVEVPGLGLTSLQGDIGFHRVSRGGRLLYTTGGQASQERELVWVTRDGEATPPAVAPGS